MIDRAQALARERLERGRIGAITYRRIPAGRHGIGAAYMATVVACADAAGIGCIRSAVLSEGGSGPGCR